jgi:hypothetical protein
MFQPLKVHDTVSGLLNQCAKQRKELDVDGVAQDKRKLLVYQTNSSKSSIDKIIASMER